MSSNPSNNLRQLVLVGGGHAHLHVMQQINSVNISNLQVVLISEFPYQYYSGMAANFIEGVYDEEQIRFNLQELCTKYQVQFVQGRVVHIDGNFKKVTLSDETVIPFDILSMDTGSKMAGSSLVGMQTYGVPVKPLVNLHKIRKACQEGISEGAHLVVVGAGAAGVEIALALQSYKEKLKQQGSVTLVESSDTILRGYRPALKNQVMKVLVKKNIQICLNAKVTEICKNSLVINTGEQILYDDLIWAGGIAADALYKESGLPVDEKGFMLVNSHLQSLSYPFIFGAGDCVSFANYKNVAKVGVYAIREAPILADNIVRFSQGKPLKRYTPQNFYLSILSLAHQTGILQYGKLVFQGTWCWKLKDYIDRSFMKKYT